MYIIVKPLVENNYKYEKAIDGIRVRPLGSKSQNSLARTTFLIDSVNTVD